MKKFYEEPEIEILGFKIEDVITTSPNAGLTITPDTETPEDSEDWGNIFS